MMKASVAALLLLFTAPLLGVAALRAGAVIDPAHG